MIVIVSLSILAVVAVVVMMQIFSMQARHQNLELRRQLAEWSVDRQQQKQKRF